MQIGSMKIDSDGSTVKVAKSAEGAVTLWLYRGGASPVVLDMKPAEAEALERLLHIANS